VTNLWNFRGLALNFLQREIKSRYVGSVSGLLWVLLHPIALLAIYSVVFQMIFRVQLPELGEFGFVAFVAVGMWPFLALQEGIQRGATVIQANGGLIKKVAFPNELLVYSSVTATYVIHSIGFFAAICTLVAMGNPLQLINLPAVLVLLSIQLLFTLGLASFFAALQVFIKDVEQFLQPFLMVWFYATPILYPIQLVPEDLQFYMRLNPMLYFVERIRELLMHGGGFVPTDAGLLFFSVLLFMLGRWFFNRLAPSFEDFL